MEPIYLKIDKKAFIVNKRNILLKKVYFNYDDIFNIIEYVINGTIFFSIKRLDFYMII